MKNKWQRPCQLAKEKGVALQVVNNWKQRGKLEIKRDEQLGITLVREKKAK